MDSLESKEGSRGTFEQERVIEISSRIGEFYHLPPNIVERGKTSQVELVGKGDLAKEAESYLKEISEYRKVHPYGITNMQIVFRHLNFDPQTLESIDQPEIDLIEKEIETTTGIFIPREDGRRLIFVRQDRIEDQNGLEEVVEHELIHSMASKGFEATGGFRIRLSDSHSLFARLDEAATEMLRLGVYPNPKKIYYIKEAILLGQLLTRTNLRGEDLAQYYFGVRADEDRLLEFMTEIVDQARPGLQKEVGDTLFEFFDSFLFEKRS